LIPTSVNIEQLIQLCISGNQSAQLEIYNRYYKAMYNTSLRIVKNSFEAEDIMQDSFLMAFTKLKTLKETRMFEAWLKKIVINTSIHHYNKNFNKHETPIDDILYKVEDVSTTHESDLDYTNLKVQQVLNTMQLLKDSYRIALTLHLIEGYDYEEISDIMNISYANSRTLISRAKENLRDKLKSIQ
jgi:RNA polymerase sigma factor (sigma-70 family)